ncbi:MAG: hypothetical protein F4Z10_00050 [Synechococcus sp. SB0666_bin_14]|nr:hypothetical protein [Synechococcus sp. SB0666_bin_14]MYA90374.1 hypothetical protein [Synechococcus sp. SB0663_bin_10]
MGQYPNNRLSAFQILGKNCIIKVCKSASVCIHWSLAICGNGNRIAKILIVIALLEVVYARQNFYDFYCLRADLLSHLLDVVGGLSAVDGLHATLLTCTRPLSFCKALQRNCEQVIVCPDH